LNKKGIKMGTEIKKITVEGRDYIPADKKIIEGDIRIVVLQRGWVFIGRFKKHGDVCKLYNSYNIRRWGTEEGLGELAEKGKLDETILDACDGVIEFHYLTMVFSIECDESKWSYLI
jgi:hypothetical protein